jgi:hypothetical protein
MSRGERSPACHRDAMSPAGAHAPAPRWRRVTSAALLVVGALVGVASVGALYGRAELLNTDRYVATVEPLADSPALRHALSGFVVTAIYQHVNVEQVAREALPARAAFLAAPLSDGIRAFSGQVVERFLASSQFRGLWSQANRLAHRQLVALLEDTARHVGPVTLRNGTVSVDLSKTIATAQRQLERAGLSFVSAVHVSPPKAQYRLIDSKLLAQVRGYVALLTTLTWVLPAIMVAAFAGAVMSDADRRRGVVRVGVAFAAGMAILTVVLAGARSFYLDAATSPHVPRDAAAAVFDTLLRYLRVGAFLGVVVGCVVAAAGWLPGPSDVAVRTRRATGAAVRRVRRQAEVLGWGPGPIAAYVAGHRSGLRVGAGALMFVLFVVWRQPTLGALIGLVVVFAVAVVGIEVVARAGAEPRSAR